MQAVVSVTPAAPTPAETPAPATSIENGGANVLESKDAVIEQSLHEGVGSSSHAETEVVESVEKLPEV